MITEELKQQNYLLFIKKLEQIGVDTKLLSEKLGEKLLNASYGLEKKSNVAYCGSLLNTILRVTTPYAIKLNEMLPEKLKSDVNSIIKICLLYQISKCEMIIPNDNNWEVENRGMIFKFAENKYALKGCIKSLLLAQECGIKFTENEVEAMLIMDRSDDDLQAKYFSSPLATIIKQANELTLLKNRLDV